MNCIAPGPVDTKTYQSGLENLKEGGEKNYQEIIKIKDPRLPKFINGLALFLAREECGLNGCPLISKRSARYF